MMTIATLQSISGTWDGLIILAVLLVTFTLEVFSLSHGASLIQVLLSVVAMIIDQLSPISKLENRFSNFQLKAISRTLSGATTCMEKFVQWTRKVLHQSYHLNQRDYFLTQIESILLQTSLSKPMNHSCLSGYNQNVVQDLVSVTDLSHLIWNRKVLSAFTKKEQMTIWLRKWQSLTICFRIYQCHKSVISSPKILRMIMTWWSSRS